MHLIQAIKNFAHPALFLMSFFQVLNVFGQGNENMTGYLSRKFNNYCEQVPREEIFVSTDREEYIAGEVLWFNIWLTDRQSSILSSDSKIIYWELLNPENRPVVQKRIGISKGTGPGQTELPDTLSTGTYTIRAYTNRMKNFFPGNCFMKDINIYNAFRSRPFKYKVLKEDELKSGKIKGNDLDTTGQFFTLQVNNQRKDTLEIFIRGNENSPAGNRDLFYLFIQTHGKINHAVPVRINGKSAKICLSKELLLPGINQISMIDPNSRLVCERYIYTPENRVSLSVHSADSFRTRSRVAIELVAQDSASGGPGPVRFSISVASATGINPGMGPDTHMIFGSEFGSLPSKILKGKKIVELPAEVTDSMLVHLNSQWTDWRMILSENQISFKNAVEKDEHYLSGKLMTFDNRLAGPGEFLLLSSPGKVAEFQYAITNEESKFVFGIPINGNNQDLILQPDNIRKNFRIHMDSSFSDQYLRTVLQSDSAGEPFPNAISRMSLNYQVERIYGITSVGTTLLTADFPSVSPRRFYGKPDAEIILGEWVRLPSMEEVFFEIVPHVTLKRTGTGYEMTMTEPFGKVLYETPPVMMIDGVIIRDLAIITGLDPQNVEKIDIVKKQYMVGDYLFNGIVNIITRTGDFSNLSIPDYSLRMPYSVVDPVPGFVSPDYSSPEMKNKREPDFRNTLYWNPCVASDSAGKATVEFWTSDIKCDYDIKIEGFTSGGKPFSIRKRITVY